MSREYPIKWRESDKKELSRLVKNFNAKIRRLEKKIGPGEVLPETVSLRDLKKSILTRKEFNREVKALQRFTQRGSEKFVSVPDNDNNLKITKWQMKEMKSLEKLELKRIEKQKERLANMPATLKRQPLGYSALQRQEFIGMGRVEDRELEPTKLFTRTMSKRELKAKYRVLRNRSRSGFFIEKDKQARDNFIKGLTLNYAENDVKDVVEAIEKMPLDDFMEIMYEEGGSLIYEYSTPTTSKSQGKTTKFVEDMAYDNYLQYLRETFLPKTEEQLING